MRRFALWMVDGMGPGLLLCVAIACLAKWVESGDAITAGIGLWCLFAACWTAWRLP